MLFRRIPKAINIVKRLNFCVVLIGLFFCAGLEAQMPDCTLGIGGKDTQVLTNVFQLNEQQLKTMELWIGELQTQSKLIEDQIKELFDNHPQSTQEELESLANKYKVLKDQIFELSKSYDRKLLGLFNEKQYQRYVALCTEALRSPMRPEAVAQISQDPE